MAELVEVPFGGRLMWDQKYYALLESRSNTGRGNFGVCAAQ